MRREFTRIGAVLLGALVVLFAAWEVLERALLEESAWTFRDTVHLVRGASSAVLLALLAAWMMARSRRRHEAELRRQVEENRRMRQFFENIVRDAGEAIISLAPDGTVRSWNRAAQAIYGYSAEEMIGQTLERLLPPDLVAAGELEELRRRTAAEGFVRDHETRRLRKDGQVRTVRITRTALKDPDGRTTGWTAIVRDITVEKEMEARLVAGKKLAAVGQAAAGIAHEVRNALAGISGAIQVLKRNPSWNDLPPGFGDEVDFQVARIARIVSDFLEFARPGELRLQPADLNKILDHALARSYNGASSASHQVRRDYAPGEVVAEVDPSWLEQAIAQIVANAYQAMGTGGVLTVSSRRGGDAVLLSLADNGCGMSAEALSHAFEPFFTTKVRGTGMGLPIVRTIVEAHRGTVAIDSAPGKGTTVTLAIPAASREETPTQARPQRSAQDLPARAAVA